MALNAIHYGVDSKQFILIETSELEKEALETLQAIHEESKGKTTSVNQLHSHPLKKHNNMRLKARSSRISLNRCSDSSSPCFNSSGCWTLHGSDKENDGIPNMKNVPKGCVNHVSYGNKLGHPHKVPIDLYD